jgi:hypothetical protein
MSKDAIEKHCSSSCKNDAVVALVKDVTPCCQDGCCQVIQTECNCDATKEKTSSAGD